MKEDMYCPKYYFPNSKVIINNDNAVSEVVKPSAFRAVNNTAGQTMTADTAVTPVLYPDVIFDVNGEYDPATATFMPKQDGIYSVIASINFIPDISPVNYRVLVQIYLNGVPVASDNDFFGEIFIGDVTAVSAILQLTAGDTVNISALASAVGIINANPAATHFEAARFPSPPVNCPTNQLILHPSTSKIKEF